MSLDWHSVHAAVWRRQNQQLRAVRDIDPIRLADLVGIEKQVDALAANTRRFLTREPANNALLWGARGTGKSSLVKAVFNEYRHKGLRLIEIYKNDLHSLPDIVDGIRDVGLRFIVYCDDFSFDVHDDSYIALKTLLEGSIERPPENVLLYATSNRRHLMPESMRDNLDSKVVDGELHYADAIEEKISLSDRFGLWLSFYQPNMDGYLEIIDRYFADFEGDREALHAAARMFSLSRGSKSGRTAKQFFNQYSGNGPA